MAQLQWNELPPLPDANALAGAAGLFLVQRYTNVHLLLHAFVGISICFVTGYVSSFAFPPTNVPSSA